MQPRIKGVAKTNTSECCNQDMIEENEHMWNCLANKQIILEANRKLTNGIKKTITKQVDLPTMSQTYDIEGLVALIPLLQ